METKIYKVLTKDDKAPIIKDFQYDTSLEYNRIGEEYPIWAIVGFEMVLFLVLLLTEKHPSNEYVIYEIEATPRHKENLFLMECDTVKFLKRYTLDEFFKEYKITPEMFPGNLELQRFITKTKELIKN